MKTTSLMLVVWGLMVGMTGWAGDVAGQVSAEAAAGAKPAEQAVKAEAEAMTPAERQEFVALQKEIRNARLELNKTEEVQAILKQADALSPENDAAKIRDLRVQARTLMEKRLAEQEGMPEKLLRLKELGEKFRKSLPAERRRKGKRLPPRKEGDASPEASAPKAAVQDTGKSAE